MEQLINFIIRPPRAEYDPQNDLLDEEFTLKGKLYQRKDLEVINSRGDVLQCSHYMPVVRPEGKPLPCVIYCHGNSGCRADASEAAIILLPSNITVFTLDFAGSGISGGEHVSLGWHEKDDLRAVVDHLRKDGNVSLIGLWGRSMGAVTSLMYGAEDPSIAGMVLDSPFSDLVDLMMELVDTYRVRLPKFTVKFAIHYMRRAILKKAKFDIMELNTVKVAKSSFVPALFGHAADDDFILPHHSDRIFDVYAGDKNIIKFEGDHNSPRPQFYFDSISIFFNNVLRPPEDEVGSAFFDLSHDIFGKSDWSSPPDIGYSDDFVDAPSDPTATSTEDAIRLVRSRRPMSVMKVPADISPRYKQSEGQEEGTGPDTSPSSSNMISFELSDGNSHGAHLAAPVNEDDYIEYSLDNLADFPSNVEEEERMLMEAVIESLKDMETRRPHVEEPSSGPGTSFPKSSPENNEEDNSLVRKDVALKTVSYSAFANKEQELTAQLLADSCKSSVEPPSKCTITEKAEVGGATCSDSFGVDQSSSQTDMINKTTINAAVVENVMSNDGTPSQKEAEEKGVTPRDEGKNTSVDDMVDCTRATVTVVKSPSTNIVDGLLRRWDLNFFRNR